MKNVIILLLLFISGCASIKSENKVDCSERLELLEPHYQESPAYFGPFIY